MTQARDYALAAQRLLTGSHSGGMSGPWQVPDCADLGIQYIKSMTSRFMEMRASRDGLANIADGDSILGGRMLKVDHAGEHGAIWIYTGQIFAARLFAKSIVAELLEFRAHEEVHRAIFWRELQRRGLPRCRSYLLCGLGGLLLGLVTGVMGKRAIAITTDAVERVVLQHLADQLHHLATCDAAACNAISSILHDEIEHQQRSAERFDQNTFLARSLGMVVAAATESVIWLGMLR